jgi:hypothetical protein
VEILAAGPWIGELGPEIGIWTPSLRLFKQQYPDVGLIACGYPGRQVLYRDFVDEYIELPDFFTQLMDTRVYNSIWGRLFDTVTKELVPLNNPDIQRVIQWFVSETQKRFSDISVRYLQPHLDVGNVRYFLPPGGVYRALQTTQRAPWRDHVMVFPRQRTNDPKRNWPMENWRELINLLLNDGFKVVLCGNVADNNDLDIVHPNFRSILGITLEGQISYIQSAQLAITSFSGACLLTAWAKCPTMIWSPQTMYDEINRREVLNPFEVPFYLLTKEERWDYSVQEVYDFAKLVLKR